MTCTTQFCYSYIIAWFTGFKTVVHVPTVVIVTFQVRKNKSNLFALQVVY